jgi:excisionase family DNA binding protein
VLRRCSPVLQFAPVRNATYQIVEAALRGDPGVTEQRLTAALAYLREGKFPDEPTEGLPLLLTVAQAARQLEVSRFTIRRLEKGGKLKPVMITPDLKRFRRADIEAFAAGGITSH